MNESVAVQAELLADLRAQTGTVVWPCDTLADLGLTWDDATPGTSVGDLIDARRRAWGN